MMGLVLGIGYCVLSGGYYILHSGVECWVLVILVVSIWYLCVDDMLCEVSGALCI